MIRIPVRAASAAYEAVVDSGGLGRARSYLEPLIAKRRLFVIADEGAFAAQGEALAAGLKGMDVEFLPEPLGEGRKRLAVVEALAERLHRAGADRSAVIAAFGGGVAGDLGGFVAAGYMRGVDVIQIPTTLLAMVDAAVGGKTGVNLASGKNLFGAFHQPKLVLVDPETLQTLPEREYRAGLFEVIKHGVIWSLGLFEFLEREREAVLARRPAALERIIADSIHIKSAVVEQDEREGGLRRILNYGHTLGHALEAETGYSRLLHGEAVGWGMTAAGRLAEIVGLLGREGRARIEELIQAYGPLPPLDGLEPERLAARVSGDKKTVGGRAHFVLPETIGKVRIVVDPPRDAVVEAARLALEACAAEAATP